MKILELYLKGYKPFFLNNIDTINVQLITELTLITGSNGSGKSSLMRELSPWPAIRGDYLKGGSKIIAIEHKQCAYTLSSDFTTGAIYSFIKDNEELNDSGTLTVQRELVATHFGYTPLLQKILSGDLLFTEMSPSQRKDTMMAISPLKLDFATKIFLESKKLARDTTGAFKHIVAKSTESRNKLGTLQYDDDIADTKLNLETELSKLVEFTRKDVIDTDILEHRLEGVLNLLDKAQVEWSKFPTIYVDDASINNLDYLKNHIGSLNGELSANQKQLESYNTELMELQSLTEALDTGSMSIDDLNKRVVDITGDIQNLNFIHTAIDNPSLRLNAVCELQQGLNNLDIPDDIVIFNKIDIATIIDLTVTVTADLAKLQGTLSAYHTRLEHLRNDDDDVICPRCELTFNVKGINITQAILEMESRISNVENSISDKEVQMSDIMERKQSLSDYQLTLNKLDMLRQIPYVPEEIWVNGPNRDSILTGNMELSNSVMRWINRLSDQQTHATLVKELEICKNSIVSHNSYDGGIGARIEKLNVGISQCLSNKGLILNRVSEARSVQKSYEYFTRITDKCILALEQLEQTFMSLTDATIHRDARTKCDEIYDRLSSITVVLRQKETLEQAIDEMDQEILDLSKRQKQLDLITECMSPINGIIADQMLGFINSYIDQMNKISEQVWGYDLSVGKCNMDNGVLDYKFPLLVEGSVVTDISNGSTGQKDIIDLAFILVMRTYMGIVDFPLYLDETGSSFDEAHRVSLMQYVQTLLDTNNCSQIFMVNHYAAVHGALRNNDVIVLDDRNITVPKNHNQNIIITHGD